MKVSRITSKYQATVPADVRAALGAGDRLGWEVDPEGGVTVRRLHAPEERHPHATLVDSKVFWEWLTEEDEGLVAAP